MIYFAHSKKIYGTDAEEALRDLIENTLGKRFKVICPNRDLIYDGRGMELYLAQVRKSKLVICSEYRGFVGKGVYEEVKEAIKNNIPVYALRGLSFIYVKDVEINDVDDWGVEYGKLITENLK